MTASALETAPEAVPSRDLPAVAVLAAHRGVPAEAAALHWPELADSERAWFRRLADAATSTAGTVPAETLRVLAAEMAAAAHENKPAGLTDHSCECVRLGRALALRDAADRLLELAGGGQ